MWIRRLCGLMLMVLLLSAGCGDPEPGPVDHDTALRKLAAQLGADREDAAVRDLRAYLRRAPDDASMHYNLACLLARGGDLDAAAASLQTALECGFQRLEQMRRDPDLSDLHADARLENLIAAHETALRERAAARALNLTGEGWSDPVDLGPGTAVRLRMSTAGLEVDLGDAAGVRGGWLVVTVPDDPDAYVGTRWWEFPLTTADGALTAAAPAQLDGAVIRVPWSALAPHRPPLDLYFGWNLVLETTDGLVGLLDDPLVGRSDQPWRRFAAATIDPGDAPSPLLVGRPDTRLVVGDTLSVELAVQGVPDGQVPVHLTSSDGAATNTEVQVDWGLGYGTALLATDGAAAGWVDLAATAEGVGLAWNGRVFRLTSDWFLTHNQRLATVSGPQQDIVRFWLFRVLRGQQNSDPRDDPSELAEAVARTEALFARWDATGSVLPAAAAVEPVGVRVSRDILVEARLSLPPAAQRQGDPSLKLVLVDETDDLASVVQDGDDTGVVLTLPAPPVPGNDALTAAQVQAAGRWLTALFPGAGNPDLAGWGRAANSAILAAAADPSAWSGLEIYADHTLDPWPLLSDGDLPAKVEPALADLVRFKILSLEAGPRAAAVMQALSP